MTRLISRGARALRGAVAAVLGCVALAAPAHAVNIKVDITVDNSYALFYGTETTATNFVGSDFSWGPAESYVFDLPSDHYIYVVTESDLKTLPRDSSASSPISIPPTGSTATIRSGR